VNLVTTRTITASLTNDREGVVRELDSLGRSGSKIWNVARWTIGRIWDHTGEIPGEGLLKSYMKNQDSVPHKSSVLMTATANEHQSFEAR
jgi:putative transposase